MDAAYERYRRALEGLDPPFAFVDLDAFWANADDLVRRAAGTPLRLASKSVRCRELQTRVLQRAGWQGQMTFTARESLWRCFKFSISERALLCADDRAPTNCESNSQTY